MHDQGAAAMGRVDAATSIDARPVRARKSGDVILGMIVFLGFLGVFLCKAPGLGFYLTSRDHGYQLSIGTQILLGKVPGADVIIAYGPLVMYTSASGTVAEPFPGRRDDSVRDGVRPLAVSDLSSRRSLRFQTRRPRRGGIWVFAAGAVLQVVRLADPAGRPLGLAPLLNRPACSPPALGCRGWRDARGLLALPA